MPKSHELAQIIIIYYFFQSSYADYIYSYAEKNVMELDRKEGAYLNSCFWVSVSVVMVTSPCLCCRSAF